ncbi:MAG: peptidoglycan-binding domain-containing protein [Burkholderiales bacterium]
MPVTTNVQPVWQTTVAVAAPSPTLGVLPKTLSETDPGARYKLVLDIQQQLKRVGCYWGRIDGSWGLATKEAMKEFTGRVNATLPLDDPDYVQLTLIQSHSEKTCGACPAGQSLSASGRCVGLPITAQAKPTAEAATVQKEVLPWKATPPSVAGGQPLFKPMPPMVVSTEPLPEHMAIGAPDTASVDVQQSALPIPPGPAAGTATAVLDPKVAAMKQPSTIAPKTEGRTRPVQPGTPRYNLLLSLGGLY